MLLIEKHVLTSDVQGSSDKDRSDAPTFGGRFLSFDRNAVIIAEGDPAHAGCQVIAGCVRWLRHFDDGRRQISEFFLPGDIFGWESVEQHDFTGEAVTATSVRRFELTSLTDRARQDNRLSMMIASRLAAQVRAGRQRVAILGRATAAEPIAHFLVEMFRRLPGEANRTLILPMNRSDIADYLGLTIETVCRRLSDLHRRGLICTDGAKISILRPDVLASDART